MILANSLTTPALGLLVWSTLIFFIFFFVLYKFAWPPVLNAIHSRNEQIRSSLLAAEKAREDMVRQQEDNREILRQAREERDIIIREARSISEDIVGEAKGKAEAEAALIVSRARESIEREKLSAMEDIRRQVATLSLDIASRILQERLEDNEEQAKLIGKYLDEMERRKN